MTDPASRDDDWQELARELGLEDAAAPPTRREPPAAEVPSSPVRYEEPAEELWPGQQVEAEQESDLADAAGEDAGDDEFEDAEEAAGEGADGEAGDAAPDEGQPGTGRKRRRRRRRRKKGAAPVSAEGSAEDAEEAGGYDVAAPAGAELDAGEPAEEDDDAAEDVDAVQLAAEEDTGSDVLRDLIASWNVPSWDEIVGGLHRPDR